MHLMPRSAARIAAIAAVIVSSGALVAVPPAIADIGADMRFLCASEAGTHQVGLRIESNTPSSGSVGEPVQLGTIRIDVDLPAELVDEVRAKSPSAAPASTVTGEPSASAPSPALAGVAQMRVGVRDDSGVRNGGWPAFALAAVPSPSDGTMRLTGSGVAPPVVPRLPGGLSWTTGDLGLSLVPDDAVADGDKAELSLHCAADKETVLGSVRVRPETQALASGARSAGPVGAAAAQEKACEEIPPPGVDPRYAINPDPTLMKIYDEPRKPDVMAELTSEGLPYCIKAAGFVNIKKAGNAIPFAAETHLRRGTIHYRTPDAYEGPNYLEQQGYLVNRTEQVPGTVLGFGFMPTRATAETVQVGAPSAGKNDPITGNIQLSLAADPFATLNFVDHTSAEIASYVQIRAATAEINGVPINLGDKCRTSTALLHASAFLGNQETGLLEPTVGETLVAENLKIPAFTGCGVTEDLSPLLTASISGPGNYVKAEAGGWCNPASGVECTAPQPETWTVRPGGDVTAVAEPFVLKARIPGTELSCASATMRFHMDAQHWRARFMLAKAALSFEGCEVKTRTATYPAQLSQEGAVWLNGTSIDDDGLVHLQTNLVLNANTEVNGTQCSLRFNDIGVFSGIDYPSSILVDYRNETGVATAKLGSSLKVSRASTCNILGFIKGGLLGSSEAEFAFSPKQEFTMP
jgi:hypothetical protein